MDSRSVSARIGAVSAGTRTVMVSSGGRRYLAVRPAETVSTVSSDAVMFDGVEKNPERSVASLLRMGRKMMLGRSVTSTFMPVAQRLDDFVGALELRMADVSAKQPKENEDMDDVLARGSNAELAAAAAHWWAERFSERRPAKPIGVPVVAAVAAVIPDESPAEHQVAAFRQSLEASIAAQLESNGSSYIKMDYDPDRALAAALQAADVDPAHAAIYLPWKTTTFIHKGEFKTQG